MSGVQSGKVMPRVHTRFEKARILGARALQISMGAPLYVSEEELREKYKSLLFLIFYYCQRLYHTLP